MWKLMSAYCGNVVLRKAAIALLAAFPTLVQAQIDFNAINTPVEKLDVEAAAGELAYLVEFIVQYPLMPDSEKRAWSSKVSSPYPDARAPVESETVDWLYAALASGSLQKQDGHWSFAYKAFQALRALDPPEDDRLVKTARAILTGDLPDTLDYLPHEGLIELCLDVLFKSADPESLALVRSAETTEFWTGRTEHAHLVDPSPYLAGESDALLLTLRSKAPAVFLNYRHDDAAAWVEEILAREDERAGYRRLIEGLVQYYSPESVKQRESSKPICVLGAIKLPPIAEEGKTYPLTP